MKASVIYNDFDRDYFKEVVMVATSLKSQAATLHEFIQNDWHHKGVKEDKKNQIKSEINRFLDQYLKDTDQDYRINELKLSEVAKATGFLEFVRVIFQTKLDERPPIDIIVST
jgi:hypothetical protein